MTRFRREGLKTIWSFLPGKSLAVTGLFSAFLHVALLLLWKDWSPETVRSKPRIMVARLLRTLPAEHRRVNGAADSPKAPPARPPAPRKGVPAGNATAAVRTGVGRAKAKVRLAASEGTVVLRAVRPVRKAGGHVRATVPPAISAVPPARFDGPVAEVEVALVEIRRRIESKKTYPLQARRRGWEGRVLVEIELGEGELEHVRLLRQSGFPVLDRATIAAVHNAVPYPLLSGKVQIPVFYRLDAGPSQGSTGP